MGGCAARPPLASPALSIPCQSSYSIHSIPPHHMNPANHSPPIALTAQSPTVLCTRPSFSKLVVLPDEEECVHSLQHPTTTAASSGAAPILGSLAVHASAEATLFCSTGRARWTPPGNANPPDPSSPLLAGSRTPAERTHRPLLSSTVTGTPTGNPVTTTPPPGSRTLPHHRSIPSFLSTWKQPSSRHYPRLKHHVFTPPPLLSSSHLSYSSPLSSLSPFFYFIPSPYYSSGQKLRELFRDSIDDATGVNRENNPGPT